MEMQENPIDATRREESNLYHEKQERLDKKRGRKPKEKPVYEVVGDKVRQIIVTPSGNKHSIYIGTKKQCRELLG